MYDKYSFVLGEFERVTETHVYFWHGPFSQWSLSPFTENSFNFCNCEQYMMARKAVAFNDPVTFDKIMKEYNPKIIKDLGQQVGNFNQIEWDVIKYGIVKEGNRAKFTQNEKFRKLLQEVNGRTLVEASPYDRIWGVGLKQDDDRILDESKWLGENLLGKAITEIALDL